MFSFLLVKPMLHPVIIRCPRIPPAVEEKFGGALVPHAGNELATIKAEVNAWNQKWGNFLRDDSRPATDTAGSVAAPSPQRSRVVCQPEFGPEDGLIDVSSTHVFLDGDMLPSDHAFEFLFSEWSEVKLKNCQTSSPCDLQRGSWHAGALVSTLLSSFL